MPRFDVYGHMVIEVVPAPDGAAGEWIAFVVGRDGKRAPAPDVPFPPGLAEADLVRHLEDVFHEHGAPGRQIRRLDP